MQHCINNELLQELSSSIEKLKASNTLIIVEGKKDKQALSQFGIKNIKELSKHSIPEIIEEIAEKEKSCIILTDLDKEGKKLYGKLSSGLQRSGVKINNSFRNFLFKETKLRNIEGLKHHKLFNE
ncbi:MAG TPA: toprim domain-containing protein [Candidatus Nanoarchaeia archaeon]|nr:toprim domain-containing protein [Candidatus Nanoarchaeia archaeon]